MRTRTQQEGDIKQIGTLTFVSFREARACTDSSYQTEHKAHDSDDSNRAGAATLPISSSRVV